VRALVLERLEDRTLLTGHSLATATALNLDYGAPSTVAGFLQAAQDVDLYSLRLQTGDTVTAGVAAQQNGSGLDGVLRVFDSVGRPIAFNNDFYGRDPQLTFQAAAAGTYYVGVSGFPETTYDPAQAPTGGAGSSSGLYDLVLSKTTRPLLPDLVGASFQIVDNAAVWGAPVTLRYAIENRGGADAGAFQVEVRLSTHNTIDTSGPLLSTFTVNGLAAGAEITGSMTVTLPGAPGSPPASFSESGNAFLGLRIDTGNTVAELNEANNSNQGQGNDLAELSVLLPQTESEPNDTTATATSIALNSQTTGTLAAGDVDFFRIAIPVSGHLTASAHAQGLNTSLALYDAQGVPLAQSDGQSPGNPDPLLIQDVQGSPGGTVYYLKVEGLDGGTGQYTLTTEFVPAQLPSQTLPLGTPLGALVKGDLNGDGILDLVAADVDANQVVVLLGKGDGTFSVPVPYTVGTSPQGLVLGDFNGDGHLDLAAADTAANLVTILFGKGDGTFENPATFPVGPGGSSPAGIGPSAIVAGDFNHDGRLDLATANTTSNDVSVLLGKGDGSFQGPVVYAVGTGPVSLVAGDLNGDGVLDLATANSVSNDVSELLGNGDGSFGTAVSLAVGTAPRSLVFADFNKDGRLDIATANSLSNDISVLLGKGGGLFGNAVRLPTGMNPGSIVAGDFNGDGLLDLATANVNGNDLFVLPGVGDGTFRSAQSYTLGFAPLALVAGDFNRDGHLDLAAASGNATTVTVLAGRGNGTFPNPERFATGAGPFSVVQGDFNGDGIPDLAAADSNGNNVAILLGQGDGTFAPPAFYAVGTSPQSVFIGDFNGDGIPDLATANANSNTVSVLLGTGHGTFQTARNLAVGPGGSSLAGIGPFAVVTGDFNHDGHVDLASANNTSGDVSVFLGNGDGSFQSPLIYKVGAGPYALITADFNGDGVLDLATANSVSNDVSVLLGTGSGTFLNAVTIAVGAGTSPHSLVAGDFNRDGHLDLAVADFNTNDIAVLLGDGTGTFQAPQYNAVAQGPFALAAGDFNHDGNLDLAAADLNAGVVSLLVGQGDGTFQNTMQYGVGKAPHGIVVGDFDRSGRLDLAIANSTGGDVSVLLGQGDATFQVPAAKPRLLPVIRGDFNGDGVVDLAVLNTNSDDVAIFVGLGDGTFQGPTRIPVGTNPSALVAGDFNGDGRLDLAVAEAYSNDVLVLLGNGDGSFQAPKRFTVGNNPTALVAGDFNGDGRLDLATANNGSSDVSVLLGNGDGTFQTQSRFGVGPGPVDLIAGVFTRDSRTDLATANYVTNDVSLLLGNGDGTFQPQKRFGTGMGPGSLVAGDFNGDGHLDLVTANRLSNDLSVMLGNGDGTFGLAVTYSVASKPAQVAVGDLNGDGILDLVTANTSTQDVTVLLGVGDGTFQSQGAFPVGASLVTLVVGDFNGDGIPDLATANLASNDVSVLLSVGDGTFPPIPGQLAVGTGPGAIVTGDFNGDGILDLATANRSTNDVTVFLGVGDGTFTKPVSYAVGTRPVALVTGDFNGDGRLDLAVANSSSFNVSILLGLGDGTFQNQMVFGVGARPLALAVGDLNGDGILDLATADRDTNNVSVLIGQRDGSFAPFRTFPVGPGGLSLAGKGPIGIVAADFNGDGRLDLATTNITSNDVSVLLGVGDGTFQAPVITPVGTGTSALGPTALVAGDFNGDGRLDLATANNVSNNVSVLLGQGDGTFHALSPYGAGANPQAIIEGNFNGDTHLDLATINFNSNDVTVLRGAGDGTFPQSMRLTVGLRPLSLIAGDFNSDGTLDLATADSNSAQVSVLLGLTNGTFVPSGTIFGPIRSTPVLADLDGDGTLDTVIVDQAGRALFRRGRPSEPGIFDPPILINPNLPLRDITVVRSIKGNLVAGIEGTSNMVALFERLPGGGFGVLETLATGTLPIHFASADLTGDGLGDLVVLNAGDGTLSVYLGTANGTFTRGPDLSAGIGAADVTLADVNGDGLPDILVPNRLTGTVTVFLNEGGGLFSPEAPFRAGTGPYSLTSLGTAFTAVSPERTEAVAVGDLNADGRPDLISVNNGQDSLGLLLGANAGGLTNSNPLAAGNRPVVVRVADFNGDKDPDLAVLNGTGVEIFLGDGLGGFQRLPVLSAGNAPSGLTVTDVNGDHIPDLIVGNRFGDVLTLLGNGDGTFQPYQRVDQNVALAVADLNRDGQPDFVVAQPSLDQVSVADAQDNRLFTQSRANGLLAPSAVQVVDLNGDGVPDLVVANSGSNNVVVYPGLGNGQFGAAHSFFAGTNPVGLMVGDVSGDGIPDLVVANQGSNDVTILLGHGLGPDWTLLPGPRLRVGEGPVATTMADIGGVQYLVVTNSQSNDVWLLPARGNGFFSDRPADVRIVPVSADPVETLVEDFNHDGKVVLVTIDSGSNELSFISNFGTKPTVETISSGGDRPVAALEGDFTHEGRTDLLVLNNGDGELAVLDVAAGTPSLVETLPFFSDRQEHPTAAGLFEQDIYVTVEGGTFPILITLPGPSSSPEEPPLTPSSLGLVPGLPPEAAIPFPSTLAPNELGNALVSSVPLPTGSLSTLSLLTASVSPTLGLSPLTETGLVRPEALFETSSVGGEDGPANPTGLPPEEEPSLIQFMIGLPDALRKSGETEEEPKPDNKGEGNGGTKEPGALLDTPEQQLLSDFCDLGGGVSRHARRSFEVDLHATKVGDRQVRSVSSDYRGLPPSHAKRLCPSGSMKKPEPDLLPGAAPPGFWSRHWNADRLVVLQAPREDDAFQKYEAEGSELPNHPWVFAFLAGVACPPNPADLTTCEKPSPASERRHTKRHGWGQDQ
jgi:hypothetical protein